MTRIVSHCGGKPLMSLGSVFCSTTAQHVGRVQNTTYFNLKRRVRLP
jgi:hypothetical protein